MAGARERGVQPEGFAALLSQGTAAFLEKDIGKLRTVAGKLSQQAFLDSQRQMVTGSVIFYSLAKFLEKAHILGDPKWPGHLTKIRAYLQQAVNACKVSPPTNESAQSLGLALQELVSECDEVSELLGRFHQSVTEKARIRIAADSYARGASLGSAAGLAGADLSSVLTYIGSTRIADKYETVPVSNRLKSAQELFKPISK